MNTQKIRKVSLALLAATSLLAQTPPPINVNVPFGFHVGNTLLPAGQYAVDIQIAQNVVRVRTADASQSIVVLTNGVGRVTKTTKSKLIFNRYGDQYFLSQVWSPDAYSGRILSKTKRELQEARNIDPTVESIVAAK